MAVNTPHPEYNQNICKWTRCRTVLGGEDEVKAAGEVYLPKLDDQDTADYNAYRLRALFFNATSRTVDSFVGMIFRVDPVEKIPDSLKDFIADATLQGQSWSDYEKAITREIIGIGRAGTLIDWSDEGRPFCCMYRAEQILNWKTRRINGKTMLSMVVLQEEVDASEFPEAATEPKTKVAPVMPTGTVNIAGETGPDKALGSTDKRGDEFEHQTVTQFRVLKLNDEGGALVYTVELWQKRQRKWQAIQTMTPQRKAKAISEIPFVFHGPNNLLPTVDRPPVDDIAIVNLSHYRSSADLEHGRHFTGLPTAYAAGFDTNKTFKIGSTVAWVSSEASAKAGYLEFTGQGLKALDTALEQKERQMAVLGARMLEKEKASAEAADTLRMKQTGEQASLAQIALTAGESFELIIRWALWWNGAADSDFAATKDLAEIELNSDFNPTDMNPQLITAIVGAVQAGLMSRDSAVYALKRGEMINPARTVEEELELIDAQPMPKAGGEPKPL